MMIEVMTTSVSFVSYQCLTGFLAYLQICTNISKRFLTSFPFLSSTMSLISHGEDHAIVSVTPLKHSRTHPLPLTTHHRSSATPSHLTSLTRTHPPIATTTDPLFLRCKSNLPAPLSPSRMPRQMQHHSSHGLAEGVPTQMP